MVLSKRARWACALWLNSGHTHTYRIRELISIQSKRSPRSPRLFPYTRSLLSPPYWWFHREDGSRCCLSTYSSGGKREAQPAGDRQRGRLMLSRDAGLDLYTVSKHGGRETKRPPRHEKAYSFTFIPQQTEVTFLRLRSEFKPLNLVNHALHKKGIPAPQSRSCI